MYKDDCHRLIDILADPALHLPRAERAARIGDAYLAYITCRDDAPTHGPSRDDAPAHARSFRDRLIASVEGTQAAQTVVRRGYGTLTNEGGLATPDAIEDHAPAEPASDPAGVDVEAMAAEIVEAPGSEASAPGETAADEAGPAAAESEPPAVETVAAEPGEPGNTVPSTQDEVSAPVDETAPTENTALQAVEAEAEAVGVAAEPETPVAKPVAIAAEPETAATEQSADDAVPAQAEVAAAPEGEVPQVADTEAGAVSVAVEPETPVAEPVAIAAEPEMATTKPSADDVDAVPAQAEVAATPEGEVPQAADTEAEAVSVAVEPETPIAEPMAVAAEPETPATEPSADDSHTVPVQAEVAVAPEGEVPHAAEVEAEIISVAAEPETPVAEPVAVAAEPETAATEPSADDGDLTPPMSADALSPNDDTVPPADEVAAQIVETEVNAPAAEPEATEVEPTAAEPTAPDNDAAPTHTEEVGSEPAGVSATEQKTRDLPLAMSGSDLSGAGTVSDAGTRTMSLQRERGVLVRTRRLRLPAGRLRATLKISVTSRSALRGSTRIVLQAKTATMRYGETEARLQRTKSAETQRHRIIVDFDNRDPSAKTFFTVIMRGIGIDAALTVEDLAIEFTPTEPHLSQA